MRTIPNILISFLMLPFSFVWGHQTQERVIPLELESEMQNALEELTREAGYPPFVLVFSNDPERSAFYERNLHLLEQTYRLEQFRRNAEKSLENIEARIKSFENRFAEQSRLFEIQQTERVKKLALYDRRLETLQTQINEGAKTLQRMILLKEAMQAWNQKVKELGYPND